MFNVLSNALKEAQEKKLVCVQKCYTFKKRHGQTVILCVVEKIVVWVEKSIAVGDAAMQYDPVLAALAWGAFRFVLQVKATTLIHCAIFVDSRQMAVNGQRAFGETIENLEAVSHLITRYAILEELYLQRNSAASEKLEDMVVRLYAEILIFLAKAKKYFQSSAKRKKIIRSLAPVKLTSLVRLAKIILTIFEDEQMSEVTVLDGQLSRLTEALSVDIQIDTAKGFTAMNALLTSLNEPIERLVDSSISTQVLLESQRLQLLHWLSPMQFSRYPKRHSEAKSLDQANGYCIMIDTSTGGILVRHPFSCYTSSGLAKHHWGRLSWINSCKKALAKPRLLQSRVFIAQRTQRRPSAAIQMKSCEVF